MTQVDHSKDQIIPFFIKWTPRALAMTAGGYYGLGIAYEWGFLALIDQVAIRILKGLFGYVGVGAMMPTVQWYSAWAVRVIFGLTCGVVYDSIEKCVGFCTSKIKGSSCYKEMAF